MNCKNICLIISILCLLIYLSGCVYEHDRELFDCEKAVCTVEIGTFDFVDADIIAVLNKLFVAANAELKRNGYERTIGISVGGFCEPSDIKPLSIQMPRQTIRSAMERLGEVVGMEVKFEQGLFRFRWSVDGDENEID